MTTEALTNSVRYSQARTVRTELRVTKNRAVVTVQDDGQGFDLEAAEHRRKGWRAWPARHFQAGSLARWLVFRAHFDRVWHAGEDFHTNCPTRGNAGRIPWNEQRHRCWRRTQRRSKS